MRTTKFFWIYVFWSLGVCFQSPKKNVTNTTFIIKTATITYVNETKIYNTTVTATAVTVTTVTAVTIAIETDTTVTDQFVTT